MGKKCLNFEKKRAVKVKFSNSAAVYQILANARKLKEVEKFKTVYVSPDRAEEDRIKNRELVRELKKLISEKPTMRHFIRHGKLISVEKT